jgi:hypothetical protein
MRGEAIDITPQEPVPDDFDQSPLVRPVFLHDPEQSVAAILPESALKPLGVGECCGVVPLSHQDFLFGPEIAHELPLQDDAEINAG